MKNAMTTGFRQATRLLLFLLLFLLMVPPPQTATAQCSLSPGNNTDITITLRSVDNNSYTYTWEVTNNKPGNGNQTSAIYFGTESATLVGTPTTGCTGCLNATWVQDWPNNTLAFTALRFDQANPALSQNTERFVYSLNYFLSTFSVLTVKGNTSPTNDDPVSFGPSVPGCESLLDPPLPIELTAFDAQVNSEGLLLNWSTASEVNNAGFEVQQEVNGDFSKRAFVAGGGTVQAPQHYQYRMTRPTPGLHTFRLKQVDFDGSFSLSPTLEIAVDVPGAFHLSEAYPNPFNPRTTFTLAVQEAEVVTVSVHNSLGQQVALLHNGLLDAGASHTFTLEADHLPSGLYMIRARGERFTATRTVSLLK